MILASVTVMFFMVWVRAYWGAMKAYHQGERNLKEQQYVKAITYFGRAIHWYTPWNPYVHRSAERLWEIGMLAEQKGDTRLSLIALQTLREGFYGARSLYTAGEEWILRSDHRIDELLMDGKIGKAIPDKPDAPQQTDAKIAESRRVTGPDPFWSILVEVGFLGWVGSVIGIIISSSENRKMIRWGGLAVLFFGLWVIGMVYA